MTELSEKNAAEVTHLREDGITNPQDGRGPLRNTNEQLGSSAVKPAAHKLDAGADLHAHRESIERLAYQLWEARGRPHGSADEDWQEAERQFSDSDESA